MTTRPFTFLLAAALAGMVATGVPLAALLLNWWLGWPPVDWRLTLWLLTAVPVFLGVSARLMASDNLLAERQRQIDQDAQEVKTQAARLALEAATAGGEEPPEPAPVPVDMTRTAMKQAVGRFMRGGEAAGSFSIRALSSIVSDGDWAALTEFYCSDAGGRVLRDRGGPLGTGWGYGWTLDTVLQALNADRLPFPDMAVPEVALYVANTAQRNTKRRSSTVVEGTVIGGKG